MRFKSSPTHCRKCIFLLICALLHLILMFQYNDIAKLSTPQSFRISLDKTTQFIPDTTLQSYEVWHATQRICMHTKTCKPPLLIWQCPAQSYSRCAGLGDRMRGIQFAFLLAIITRRVFLIDWPSQPFPIKTTMVPSRIDWTMPNSHAHSNSTDLFLDWHPCIKSILCLKPVTRFPNYHKLPMRNGSVSRRAFAKVDERPSVDIHRDDVREVWKNYNVIRIAESMQPDAIQALLGNEYLQPYIDSLQQHSLLNLQRLLTQTLFAPSKAVQHRMKRFLLRKTPYIGVHIRNGKDFGEKERRFDSIKQNENRTVIHVLKCISELVSNKSAPFNQVSRKQVHLYLASDSTNMKSLFRKYSRQFKMRVHMISEKAMHIAKTRQIHSRYNSARRKPFRNVFVDMFMLAGSCVLLGTGSGFSNTSWAFGSSVDYFQIAVDEGEKNAGCMLTRVYDE